MLNSVSSGCFQGSKRLEIVHPTVNKHDINIESITAIHKEATTYILHSTYIILHTTKKMNNQERDGAIACAPIEQTIENDDKYLELG
jgi:hypothetical protein